MATTDDRTSPHSPLTPANRKPCNVCNKSVYLHQPLLLCENCNVVFHGKCLGISNYDIFNLQQTNWWCSSCSANNNLKCYACSLKILLTTEKFEICKNCFLPVHKNCSFYKTCLNCINDFKPTNMKYDAINLPEHTHSPVEDDYYKNLPFFNPFEEISDSFLMVYLKAITSMKSSR